MTDPARSTRPGAAYPAFATFKSFLSGLKGNVLPDRIDNSVFGSLSGSAKSEVKTALRFLFLIDEKSVVTKEFRDLMTTFETPEWGTALGKVLDRAYTPILENINIENGTHSQLHDRFRTTGGLNGTTVRDKAIRFWLAAMNEAGRKVSPHFGAVPVSSANGAARAKAKARTRTPKLGKSATEGTTKQPDLPGTKSVDFLIPGKPAVKITMPDPITVDEWAMVDSYLRAYIKLNMAGGNTNSHRAPLAKE
ncbi:MAG: hypothetical protein SFU57_12910 [Gemmatimonadales bacterium]|nr:hypothetical protein [Gemmatimonadales bacterium]